MMLVRKLDGLIITHYDADHAAGAELLLSYIPAETLYLPDADPEHKIRDSLNAQYGDTICWLGGEGTAAERCLMGLLYSNCI